MNSLRLLALTIVSIFISLCCGNQPPYQVSLFVNLHPKGLPVHLCNGAIVQSRLVLTTASCLHYQFSTKGNVFPLSPHMLQVVSGSSSEFNDELMVGVSNITIAANYNFTTGDNDLALLGLNEKLPLNLRNDMSWITLEDADNFEGPCMGNFYVRNSLSTAPNYIQSEELPLLDDEICRGNSKFPHARENDVCSEYILPLGFNCLAFENLLPYNGDRGTGLVCDNKLVGLLSTVLNVDEDDNQSDCSDKPVKAFYTSLAPHLEWIYTIIADEDLEMYEHGDYVSSLPYAGENNAMAETETPVTPSTKEPGVTPSFVGSVIAEATDSLTNMFSTGSSLSGVKYVTLTIGIWIGSYHFI